MKILIFSLLILTLSANIAFAKTTVLFSPEDNIQERIIKNIQLSRTSIDIVVFKLSAEELSASLLDAKEKGVKIKIIADLEEATKEISKITGLIEKGIEVKLMKDVHQNFALFDQKALFTGSYNWTKEGIKEYSNATFTANHPLVRAYLKEFNRLINL